MNNTIQKKETILTLWLLSVVFIISDEVIAISNLVTYPSSYTNQIQTVIVFASVISRMIPTILLSAYFIMYPGFVTILKNKKKKMPVLFALTLFLYTLPYIGDNIVFVYIVFSQMRIDYIIKCVILTALMIIAGIICLKGKKFNSILFIAFLFEMLTLLYSDGYAISLSRFVLFAIIAVVMAVGIICFIYKKFDLFLYIAFGIGWLICSFTGRGIMPFTATISVYCIFNNVVPSPTEKLAEQKEKLDKGLITEEEYNAFKAKIINSL